MTDLDEEHGPARVILVNRTTGPEGIVMSLVAALVLDGFDVSILLRDTVEHNVVLVLDPDAPLMADGTQVSHVHRQGEQN